MSGRPFPWLLILLLLSGVLPPAFSEPATESSSVKPAPAPPAFPSGSPLDFVEVVSLEPGIVIDLPYAGPHNFTGRQLYPVERCFLRRAVAEQLVLAHRSLAKHGVGIKIWDGYRPRSVQYLMWEAAPKPGYVGNPQRGSKHNRGAAVDVTLVDLQTGKEREMPTPYDEFSPRAHANSLRVTPRAAENRRLLQETMRAHGFLTISSEWWHFDYHAWRTFPLSDVPIETLAKQADETRKAE